MDLRSIPAEVHAFESHPSHFKDAMHLCYAPAQKTGMIRFLMRIFPKNILRNYSAQKRKLGLFYRFNKNHLNIPF